MALVNDCANISMQMIFVNTETGKTNKPNEFVLNLLWRLDFRSLNKHVAVQNLSIYCTWKNIRQQYKINNLKIIVATWNDWFELPDGSYSVSDSQYYIN